MGKIKITAWHATHDQFCKVARFGTKCGIGLGITHFPVPEVMELPKGMGHEDMLDEAFTFFNWVLEEFQAPETVNAFADEHNSHCSMSVGDLVEIEGAGFWIVEGVGWKKLNIQNG